MATLGTYNYSPENVANIQKKVKEYLGCEDMVSEYITVMVRNNKTQDEILGDLWEFVGGLEKAKEFLVWLWSYIPSYFESLQKPAVDTTMTSSPPPTAISPKDNGSNKPTQRIILNAAKQAADDTKNIRIPMSEENGDNIDINNNNNNNNKYAGFKNKKEKPNNHHNKNKGKNETNFTITLNDINSLASDNNGSNSPNGLSKKRKNINRDEEDIISKDNSLDDPINSPLENLTAKKSKKERCQFWPLCRNGEACIYHHPSIQCSNFPNCTFGNKCLYIHPSIPCKYGTSCTNPDCVYNHPQRPAVPTMAEIPCRNGFACPNRKTCGFYHPPPACKFGTACNMGRNCPFGHGKPCSFGISCVTPNCTFAHHSTEQPVPDCKFGKDCTNPKCKFTHTEEREIDKVEMNTDQISATLPPTPPTEIENQSAINV
ncbi:hypothetical protein DICPUDRAFT_154989 [Dictyostelium purpureum]|uniref:Zinc finger CCCH domain-containing protein 14 n=1 Tax=Dictyostelium purpureum TaxID=5786 RepID=F0ZSS5_DICPU|nr:uncharacterized protein DICPUDRAFT_154989 [Dictyostelium purpureum]EGC33006.1 hypothetical protein DICPUDRAFT_154989 [Dictyostelium purpureum]|eukprot:XP_003290476.1 hypothetical protein DICPUDRAFT_154989 [Dictyostelium purpureum]